MMCVDLFARLQQCAKTCMSVKVVQKEKGRTEQKSCIA